MLLFILDGFKGSYKVSFVVDGIEDTEYVDTAVGSMMNECGDYIIGVIAIADQVLTAQKHLQSGIRHQLFQDADSFPGVFIQKPGHDVKGGTTPDFHGPESYLVHLRGNGLHLSGSHPGGKKGLVSITQGKISNFYWILAAFLSGAHIYVSSSSMNVIVGLAIGELSLRASWFWLSLVPGARKAAT